MDAYLRGKKYLTTPWIKEITLFYIDCGIIRGSIVVNVLCYKSEDRWFNPSWCHWNFSLT